MTRQRQQIKRALALRDRAAVNASRSDVELALDLVRLTNPLGEPLNAWQRRAWARVFGGFIRERR